MLFKYPLIACFICFSQLCFSQDAPAPGYLSQQHFPDSVLNVELTTINNDQLIFSEILKKYKEKKVLLIFWASWCPDSRAALPKIKKLQKKMKNEEVEFVFVSTDNDFETWKTAIKKLKIDGEHYWFHEVQENELTNYIELDWIPRFMVLDTTGKIVFTKSVRADDPELKQALLK